MRRPERTRSPLGLSRRSFLYAGGGAVALAAGYPLVQALRREPVGAWRPGPFGPLRPDPAGLLDLPEGFSYRVLTRTGDVMSDGLRTPARPDGMACFALPDGALVLMRNHENPGELGWLGPWTGEPSPKAWRPGGMGGVSRVVLDPATGQVRSTNLVLGGTVLNCAGGPSPWGWLSCEETHSREHGLVFACDPTASEIAEPQPIPAYGRFRHEAVAIDPRTHAAYLTEDREDGCLYRFRPDHPDRPFEGRLEALGVRGRPGMDTAQGLAVGDRLEIAWVPLRSGDPEEGDVLRHLAKRAGAATFARGEGIAWASTAPEGAVFCASIGGPSGRGQIFRVEPSGDGGELVVLAQSPGSVALDMPDNLVMSPHGLLFFCEDGRDRNYVRGLDAHGELFDFARNAGSGSELAGCCFDPRGERLFLNLQSDGLTIAVEGPFEQGRALAMAVPDFGSAG